MVSKRKTQGVEDAESETWPVPPTNYADLREFCRDHGLAIQAENEAAWMSKIDDWFLSMSEERLRLTLKDGTVATARAHVVGSFVSTPKAKQSRNSLLNQLGISVLTGEEVEKETSFKPGYEHPTIPESHHQASQNVLDFGLAHNISELQGPHEGCSMDDIWDYTLIAQYLGRYEGVYRAEAVADTTWIYMVFDNVTIEPA